jgi:hypothetical protein
MATFPAVQPDERVYDLGQVPSETYVGPGGVPYVFRLGTVQVGATVEFPFTDRLASEVETIWDHYTTQQKEPFDLPSAVWCGHTAAATIAGAGLLWQYVDEPSVSRKSAGIASISVKLEAVGVSIGPTESATVASGLFAGITGAGVATAPVTPVPISDPPIIPPTTTITPPVELIVPPCSIEIGSFVELRHGTAGFMDTGIIEIGSQVTLSFDP